MLKLTSTKNAGFQIPAQLPEAVAHMRQSLYVLFQDFLSPELQPYEEDYTNIIEANAAWVEAGEALHRFEQALRQLDYNLNLGDPVHEPGTTLQDPVEEEDTDDSFDNPF